MDPNDSPTNSGMPLSNKRAHSPSSQKVESASTFVTKSSQEEEKEPMPSTSRDVSNDERATIADAKSQVVDKFFASNKSCINDHLVLCKTYLSGKEKNCISQMSCLDVSAKVLEDKMHQLGKKIYELYTPNVHVLETVDLGTLDQSYLKSVTNKTKDYQSKKLKIHREIKLKDPNKDKDLTSNETKIEKNMENDPNLNEIEAVQLPENIAKPKHYIIHNCNKLCMDTYDNQKKNTTHMLSTPLYFGFKRFVVYYNNKQKCIIYKTPCKKAIRNIQEMFEYLTITKSKVTIDQFNFDSWVNPLNYFKVRKYNRFLHDLSGGVELNAISVVNCIDNRLPPPMVYLDSRQPMPGVYINLDSNFLCGCDCTDNCQDKSKCACWKLTIEAQNVLPKRYRDPNVGYDYRRLPNEVVTGIYECNKNCKCSRSCLNRVVQYPLSQKLQLFMTEKKGWGVRCLNDIPQGSFVCNYVGHVFTERDGEVIGEKYGDEYFANLDHIETVERVKRDYESDYREESDNNDNDDSSEKSHKSDENQQNTSGGKSSNESKMSLRKRKPTINTKTKRNGRNVPSKLNSRNKKNNRESSKSVREYFGSNESLYIMDSKKSGNITRYLNHSCSPNTFVQNVFVDTHDLRFPWISLFAKHYIEAGTELTWDYAYEIGSVPGKVIKCHCGSNNCRRRLL